MFGFTAGTGNGVGVEFVRTIGFVGLLLGIRLVVESVTFAILGAEVVALLTRTDSIAPVLFFRTSLLRFRYSCNETCMVT